MQIAILLYSGVSALDAVGPWEVLSHLPDVEIRFVGLEVGPVVAEGGPALRRGGDVAEHEPGAAYRLDQVRRAELQSCSVRSAEVAHRADRIRI